MVVLVVEDAVVWTDDLSDKPQDLREKCRRLVGQRRTNEKRRTATNPGTNKPLLAGKAGLKTSFTLFVSSRFPAWTVGPWLRWTKALCIALALSHLLAPPFDSSNYLRESFKVHIWPHAAKKQKVRRQSGIQF